MTLQEFESKLSAKELQEFKENLANPMVRVVSHGSETIEQYLNTCDEDYDLEDFVGGAFLWYKTSQGHAYWKKISQR